jgi:hypothetical protein
MGITAADTASSRPPGVNISSPSLLHVRLHENIQQETGARCDADPVASTTDSLRCSCMNLCSCSLTPKLPQYCSFMISMPSAPDNYSWPQAGAWQLTYKAAQQGHGRKQLHSNG